MKKILLLLGVLIFLLAVAVNFDMAMQRPRLDPSDPTIAWPESITEDWELAEWAVDPQYCGAYIEALKKGPGAPHSVHWQVFENEELVQVNWAYAEDGELVQFAEGWSAVYLEVYIEKFDLKDEGRYPALINGMKAVCGLTEENTDLGVLLTIPLP